jgi:hypothetical protein
MSGTRRPLSNQRIERKHEEKERRNDCEKQKRDVWLKTMSTLKEKAKRPIKDKKSLEGNNSKETKRCRKRLASRVRLLLNVEKAQFNLLHRQFSVQLHILVENITSKPFEWSKGEARFPLGRIVNCMEGFFT